MPRPVPSDCRSVVTRGEHAPTPIALDPRPRGRCPPPCLRTDKRGRRNARRVRRPKALSLPHVPIGGRRPLTQWSLRWSRDAYARSAGKHYIVLQGIGRSGAVTDALNACHLQAAHCCESGASGSVAGRRHQPYWSRSTAAPTGTRLWLVAHGGSDTSYQPRCMLYATTGFGAATTVARPGAARPSPKLPRNTRACGRLSRYICECSPGGRVPTCMRVRGCRSDLRPGGRIVHRATELSLIVHFEIAVYTRG